MESKLLFFLLLPLLSFSVCAAHENHHGITTKTSTSTTETSEIPTSSSMETLSTPTSPTTTSTSSISKTKTCKAKDTTIIISSEATQRNLCDVSCEPLQPTTIYIDQTITSIDSFVHTVSETITVTVFRGEVETTKIVETTTSKIIFTTTVSNIGSIFTTSFLTQLVILTRSFNQVSRTYTPAIRTEASRTTTTTTSTKLFTSAFTSSITFQTFEVSTRTIITGTDFQTVTTTKILTALDLGTIQTTIFLINYEYSYTNTFFALVPTLTKFFENNAVTVTVAPTFTITGDSGGYTSFQVFITRYSQPIYSSVLTTVTWSRLYDYVANP